MGSLRVLGRCSFLDQFIDGLTDALHNIFKRVIVGRPSRDRFAICREDLEFGEGRSLPVGGTQNDGQDTRLVSVMPCDSLRHLNTVTEVRGQKVSAD